MQEEIRDETISNPAQKWFMHFKDDFLFQISPSKGY